MTAPFPPDESFLRGAIWTAFGIPGNQLEELLYALGLSRRELWIAIARSW